MAIVVTAYPYFLEHNDRAWKDEKANKKPGGRLHHLPTE
jgi:hypothetical protein